MKSKNADDQEKSEMSLGERKHQNPPRRLPAQHKWNTPTCDVGGETASQKNGDQHHEECGIEINVASTTVGGVSPTNMAASKGE
jgi:hypothetical protein